MPARPVILSGIQPSGVLTLGNYLGALKQWVALQQTHQCYFMLVDLHAITVKQEPATFAARCLDFIALYLACGIDPKESVVFIQSHVPQHAELAWVLNCFTSMGELSRMTQFKEKAQQHEASINAGLFDYPVLMAADILLYDTALVPVGQDQKQHLELTRDVAQRFNNAHGPVLRVPEPFIPKVGARIMSLQEPDKKMSKSDDNAGNFVSLLDPPTVAAKKIKRAVTDSGQEIKAAPDKPGVTNLLTILSAISQTSVDELEGRYVGKGYGHLKTDVAEAVVSVLTPLQERYLAMRSDEDGLRRVLAEGSARARATASTVLDRVHRALGFVPRDAQ